MIVIQSVIYFLMHVFFSGVEEKSCTNGLPNFCVIFATGYHGKSVTFQNSNQLFPDILGSAHVPVIDEILMAPDS
jgi:hypothetical protein